MVHDSAAPVFDKSVLMDCLSGDEESVAEVCQAFLDEFPNEIRLLRSLLDARDLEGLQCKAHGIKGAAANMGSEALRQAAFNLEKAAQAADIPSAEQSMANVDAQFIRLKAAIAQHF